VSTVTVELLGQYVSLRVGVREILLWREDAEQIREALDLAIWEEEL
jgi:hypothetical protein